jgi:hypothetical protein
MSNKRDREERNDALDDVYSRKNARKESKSETISDDAKLNRMQHAKPYLKDIRKMKPTPGKLDSVFIDDDGNEYYRIYPIKEWRLKCPTLNNYINSTRGRIPIFRVSKVLPRIVEVYQEQMIFISKSNPERKYTVNDMTIFDQLDSRIMIGMISDITPFET